MTEKNRYTKVKTSSSFHIHTMLRFILSRDCTYEVNIYPLLHDLIMQLCLSFYLFSEWQNVYFMPRVINKLKLDYYKT